MPKRDFLDLSFTPAECLSPPRPHDLHIHLPPNFCAFESLVQAVEMAEIQGISVLGASNYYWYGYYPYFAQQCLARGIFPLLGMEIVAMNDLLREQRLQVNDKNPGRTYLLGIGAPGLLDVEYCHAQAVADLRAITERDTLRMQKMLGKINDCICAWDLSLDYDSLCRDNDERSGAPLGATVLQERHLAQAVQEAIFAAFEGLDRAELLHELCNAEVICIDDPLVVQNQIRSSLLRAGGRCYVDEDFPSVRDAANIVWGHGGMLWYPAVGDGLDQPTWFEQDPGALIENVKLLGACGVQLIPQRNSLEWVKKFAGPIHDSGLLLCVGTEHNTKQMLPLMPACEDGELPEDVFTWCWEGACTCVWWQMAALRGLIEAESVGSIPEEAALIGQSVINQLSVA